MDMEQLSDQWETNQTTGNITQNSFFTNDSNLTSTETVQSAKERYGLTITHIAVWVHLAILSLGLVTNPMIIYLLFKRRIGGE